MSYRIFELPLALCPDNTPAIQILCQRDQVSTGIGRLWLGKNFALSGSPPDSYALLQTFASFAWHGVLQAEYPADTLCIDTRIGAQIKLDGPDLILDEVSDFDAIGGAYWVFIDDEILFLADPVMTAAGVYKINTVRGQYGTPIQDHPAGRDVYIINAKSFAPISFPTLLPGNTGQFKVTLGVQVVSDQVASTPGYEGSFFSIAAPGLITVNGVAGNTIVPVTTNFTIGWQAPAINGMLPSLSKVSTLIQIITPSATYSVSVAAPTLTKAITWTDLPADANCGFTLKLTTQVDTGDNIISGTPEDLFVGVIGPGLIGKFYNDALDPTGTLAFTAPVALTRVDNNLDVDFGGTSPSASPSGSWSARWTGCLLTTAAAGSYSFGLYSDDGSRLYINGQLVVDNWASHGASTTGTITLAANTRYSIVVEYYQYAGPDFLHLSWQPTGAGGLTIINSTNLTTA